MSKGYVAVISPAKRIESGVSKGYKDLSIPMFIDEAEYLSKKMKKFSAGKISSLMGVSNDIGQLNFERFAKWDRNFNESNSDATLLTFKGDVYRGMGAEDFTPKEMEFANDHLRILSGMYGVLKPLDRMMPYRLEMGTSVKLTSKITNLYQYWGNKIANALENELDSDAVILNLASNEYWKAVPKKALKHPIVEFKFLDLKNGEYKSIMTYAKLGRGYMCRFIVKNQIQNWKDLRGFDSNNYLYSDSLSSEYEMVFTRDIVQL